MKIAPINKSLTKIGFQGFKPIKDDFGEKCYEFNFPFDSNAYNCFLEIYNVERDAHGNFHVTDMIDNVDTQDGTFKIVPGANRINLADSYFIDENTPFAYHYKLVDKAGNASFRVDSGDVIDNSASKDYEIYNVVSQRGSRLARGGSMKLVIPDNFDASVKYNKELFSKEYIIKNDKNLNKAMKSYKNFSNKIGGSLAGIEKAIDNGEFDGYSNIISLPIFTDDSLSAHGYWNKNCMQMSNSLGNINNYASLQRKMFAKGINWVSDGAFVNEGLEGIHFANLLKWGEKSPYFRWFKADGLKNGPLMLGVFGKNTEFVSHKIVNSPYKYEQDNDGIIKISKNRNYDEKKPTYIQIFDNRLVSKTQKNDHENLITSYDILNTQNPYEINTHDDTVINYHFEINPETYNSNIKRINEYNKTHDTKIKLDSFEGTKVAGKFETYELESKIEGNFDTWDANTDIAKLNYVYSHTDTESGKNLKTEKRWERDALVEKYNYEVQDYVVTSGAYWTQKTKDILTLHIAQNLKNIDKENVGAVLLRINDRINNNVFPKRLRTDINENVVRNVLEGTYYTDKEFSGDLYTNQIKKGLMNFPLDTVEFGDNIVGVLASPYITKRASHKDDVGVSRYDLYAKGNPHLSKEYKRSYEKTQAMYDVEMLNFAQNVLKKAEKELPEKFSIGDNVSQYGEYVLPLVLPEIAKFAVIKSLQPNAKVYINKETGEIGYDYDSLKQVSLQAVGIDGASPEDEALTLIEKMRSGINKIDEADKKLLAGAIVKSLKGTSTESFALADMIIDRSQSGLDWRIDATKDIADIEALRSGKNNFEYTYNQISDFWSKFNDSILKINPNAYLVAELTDELDKKGVVKRFLNDTGMTSAANYSYFFNGIIMMYGKKFEYEKDNMAYNINDLPASIYNKLVGADDYLRNSNLQSLLYSYTFIGNHDKPRALHCFALDMDMFFADLNDNNTPRNFKERAFRILNDRFDGNAISDKELNNFDFSTVSPKAVAMAETIRTGFIDTLNKLGNEKRGNFSSKHTEIFVAISKAITDLANGSYLDDDFNADAFAVKPFDVVIDTVVNQACEKYNLPLDRDDIELYKNETFRAILEPAYSRLVGAMKYLVALPGKPTLYSGDDLGATGYEEKTKNIYLQNRGYIHNEWLMDKNKKFIKDKYDELKEIMGMRARPELDALNNGAPFTLPMQEVSNNGYKTKITAILHQNTDGRMAISLFNTAGIHHDHNKKIDVVPMYLNDDKIYLGEFFGDKKIGLKGGLTVGMEFIDANNPSDKYKVCIDNNKQYVLKNTDDKPICVKDSTMILYHVPKGFKESFCGNVNYKVPTADVAKVYSLTH